MTILGLLAIDTQDILGGPKNLVYMHFDLLMFTVFEIKAEKLQVYEIILKEMLY